MRQTRTLLIMAAIIICGTAKADKYVGGDISLLSEYEDHGAVYYDTDGATKISDLLTYFSSQGHNAMRVRLFHTPANASEEDQGEGVVQDLEYVCSLGKRIKDAGFAFMLDIHYSDTWADPSNQWLPAAWEELSTDDLEDSVYNYTKMVLEALTEAGATPDFIQTGNEISYGMLWGSEGGSSSKKYYAGQGTNLTYFVGLLERATEACREICPDAKIVLHTERVANTTYLKNFYNDMEDNGIDYDIIGTSYYSYYHGALSQLESALTILENNFDKEIMIVEVGYYHVYQPSSVTYDLSSTYEISEEGQQAFTEDLITVLNDHESVTGLFWWDMEANEYGLDWDTQRVTDAWYNAGLFDNETGKAMSAITILQDFLEVEEEDEETVEKDGLDEDDPIYLYYINDLEWDNTYLCCYDSDWAFVWDTEWSTDGLELTNLVTTLDEGDVYKLNYEGDDTSTPTYLIFFNGSYGTGNQSSNLVYANGSWYDSDSKISAPLTIFDENSVNAVEDESDATALLARAFTSGEYTTLCVPFAISSDEIESVFGTDTKLYVFSGETSGTELQFSSATEIEAGKPYIIMPGQDVEDPQFEDVSIISGVRKAITDSEGDYQMLGVYSPTDIPTDGTAYIIGSDASASSASDSELLGLRAYIIVPEGTEGITLALDGISTGIGKIGSEEAKTGSYIYNLNGQRISGNLESLGKGVYIQDGKKVIIR